MTEKQITKQLESIGKEFRSNSTLSRDDKKHLDSLVLSNIKQDTQKKPSLFLLQFADAFVPQSIALKQPAVFALVMGLFVITSFATVNASKNSLPGNPLYNIKVTSERVRYTLSFSEADKARASLDIARRRAGEFSSLVSRVGSSSDIAARISFELTTELNNAKEKMVQIRESGDLGGALAVATELDQNIQNITAEIEKNEFENQIQGIFPALCTLGT